MNNESKKPWESKTNIAAVAIAVAPMIPQANEFISHNPEAFSGIISLLMVLLRFVTKGKVSIK